MASIYLGQRVAPGGFAKPVVLKRLRPELASKPALLAMFLREASLSATLDHPSIVRTFDLAKQAGEYYLVMEYVRGGDLRLLLRRARRRGQRFSAAAALRLGRELLGALEYAHEHCDPDGKPLGLSHRDVSPANILVSTEGEIKLSDFGIALTGAAEPSAEGGVRVRGKVGYMSPEQASGAEVDARSDLFALATVLYEVLTGKRLFIGQPGQPIAEIYSASMIPPSQLCPELPGAGDAILRKALALRPEARYQSAREFYEALLDLTRAHQLWLDRRGFAEHLREICGPDPAAWRMLEERTGTALIPSLLVPEFESADAADSSDGLPAVAPPAADHISDHVITVPWPTVPHKELAASPTSATVPSPDITMPVPSAELTEVNLTHDAITSPAPLVDPTVALNVSGAGRGPGQVSGQGPGRRGTSSDPSHSASLVQIVAAAADLDATAPPPSYGASLPSLSTRKVSLSSSLPSLLVARCRALWNWLRAYLYSS